MQAERLLSDFNVNRRDSCPEQFVDYDVLEYRQASWQGRESKVGMIEDSIAALYLVERGWNLTCVRHRAVFRRGTWSPQSKLMLSCT